MLLDGSAECEMVLDSIRGLSGWIPISIELIGLGNAGMPSVIDDLDGRLRFLAAPFAHDGSGASFRVTSATDPAVVARTVTDQGTADMLVLPVHGNWPGEGGSFGALTNGMLGAVRWPMLFVRVESFFPLGAVAGCAHPSKAR